MLAFNHGYSREILLDSGEVAAIRADIQTVRACSRPRACLLAAACSCSCSLTHNRVRLHLYATGGGASE